MAKTLVEKLQEQLGSNLDSTPIEVKVVLDNPSYQPTAGDNRGTTSIGVWVDDTHLPKPKRMPINDAVGKGLKNVVFRSTSVMTQILQTEDPETGMVLLPGNIKPNAEGVYWLNKVPAILTRPETDDEDEEDED